MKKLTVKIYETLFLLLLLAALCSCSKDETQEQHTKRQNISISFHSEMTGCEVKVLKISFYSETGLEVLPGHVDSKQGDVTISSDRDYQTIIQDIPIQDISQIVLSYRLQLSDTEQEYSFTKAINITEYLPIMDSNILRVRFIPSGYSYYEDGVIFILSDIQNGGSSANLEPWEEHGGSVSVTL